MPLKNAKTGYQHINTSPLSYIGAAHFVLFSVHLF